MTWKPAPVSLLYFLLTTHPSHPSPAQQGFLHFNSVLNIQIRNVAKCLFWKFDYNSQPQFVLSLFLFVDKFQAQCSYNIVLNHKPECTPDHYCRSYGYEYIEKRTKSLTKTNPRFLMFRDNSIN